MPAITVEHTLLLARVPRPDRATSTLAVVEVVTSQQEAEGGVHYGPFVMNTREEIRQPSTTSEQVGS